MIDLAQKGMSKGELDSVLKAVGGLDNLLDQKSKSYASLAYLAYDEDKNEKLLEDGTLRKTPIVRNGRQAKMCIRDRGTHALRGCRPRDLQAAGALSHA